MLSRLSSFSGPLSPLFKIPGGFTLNGLILRYVIGDTDSYSGTSSVIDLQGNSNANLVNGPTFSINGYLNFDGSNDYLVTNTSLLPDLSPPNTSAIISFFCWIYIQDNGVIISEQGTSTPDSNWFDSQIELVSGTLRFSVWPYTVGSSRITSSIITPLNNWYYVGLTYDGSTLKAYVNGILAGSSTYSRQIPNLGLFYTIGFGSATNQGDGTYAKMKFGDFHVYNTALTQQQILNNYNANKNSYIHTGSMSIWIDANDPESFSGGLVNDLSGNNYTHTLGSGATSSTIFGFKSFDLTALSNGQISVNGTGPTLPTSGYTYVAWSRISSSSSTFRTLFRSSPNDHPLLVNINTDNLGFWDNDVLSFVDSGYDVTSIEEKWIQYSVVGDSSSSIFYINDVQVGTVSLSAAGNKHWLIGLTGQPFGYVGNMMLYNKKLTQTEIKQNYDALKHVYANGNFVVDNLKLYFNPASYLSYPSSGTTVTDLTGNSLNGTLSNITFTNPYFTFNGSNSTISAPDSSLIEPGSGNLTVEVWINHSVIAGSSRCILSKTDGGNAADWGYGLRTSASGATFIEIGNGSTSTTSPSYTLSTNTWYQVVGVFNNTSNLLTLYVNGVNRGSNPNSYASIRNTTRPLSIGSFDGGGTFGQWINGKIGIVRIYSSALSDSEVSKNFEANRDIYGI